MIKLAALIGIVATLAVAVILLSQVPGGAPRDGGPLHISGELQVAFPLPPDTVSTWGLPFPESDLTPAQVTGVQLVDVQNVEVVGVAGCVGWALQPDGSYNHCAPVNALGWPPPGVSLVPVAGLDLGATAQDSPGLLIGVKRQDPAADGTIGAIRILYRAGGVSYFAIEPWSLRLTVPQ